MSPRIVENTHKNVISNKINSSQATSAADDQGEVLMRVASSGGNSSAMIGSMEGLHGKKINLVAQDSANNSQASRVAMGHVQSSNDYNSSQKTSQVIEARSYSLQVPQINGYE